MSDAARQNLKVSREGIVLIKSFEGFRPRAIQRENGGWMIGYGHTLSAREGASVSEADAELLLRYDLLPVEKSLNETVPGDLNQHQFDALVSFAFSVGVDRFAGSDVRQRLNAGSPGEAADAMMGWPEPALPETALRRRAAERALFVANPGAPVALSDLLSAPLPPPAVVIPAEEPVEEPPAETLVETGPAPVIETAPEALIDPRGAAVAALLGEPAARIVQDGTPVAEEIEALAPSNDNPPTGVESEDGATLSSDTDPTPAAILEVPPTAPVEQTASDEDVAEPIDEPVADAPSAPEASADADAPAASTQHNAPWANTVGMFPAARYAPYNLSMVGPLPYLQAASAKEEPATVEAQAIDPSVVETTLSPVEEPAVEGAASKTVSETTPDTGPALVAAEPTSVEPMAYVAPVDPAPLAELVLTPLEDAPEPAFERPLWTPEERDAPDGSETNLFGEDLTLTLGGGSIMRHEIEFEAPAKFDWSETGPFIFMGGVGLVSFGASMAAFRRAAEQSGGSELTIIGWVLALIGLACVGVSSVNLYRKFGLPGGD